MKARRPFHFKGHIDRGHGWEKYNGTVRRGWKVRLTDKQAQSMRELVTKEEKRAYITHSGGSWYEVRYGDKVEKVQGKGNAESLRDKLNE